MDSPYMAARAIARKYMTPDPEAAPQVVCVKVVPNIEPNAEGIWRKVVAEPRHLNPRKHGEHRTMWDALCDLVPPGHHVVGLRHDLRFENKPGDWMPNPKES